jgi:hypothetical protein
MSALHIALQDGFAGEPVVIRLDGREVYRKEAVRTDIRISRADAVDVETANRSGAIEVEARGQAASASVDVARTPYVSVSLDGSGRPQVRTSAEPFAYL